jgi:predicted  nucleic acid-binding Zn-ribbon protein
MSDAGIRNLARIQELEYLLRIAEGEKEEAVESLLTFKRRYLSGKKKIKELTEELSDARHRISNLRERLEHR